MMYIHETLESFTSLLGATYENGGGPVGSDSPVVSVKFDRKDELDKPKCSSSSTKELSNFLSSVRSSSSKIEEIECTFPSLSLEMQHQQQGQKNNESEGSARTSCRKRKCEIYLAHPVIEAMNSPSSSLSHDSTRLLEQAWNELSPKSELSELLSRDLVFSNDFSDRVVSTTRTLLEEAPKDMLQNIVGTMERLVDSRMRSYATFLVVKKKLNSAATNEDKKKNEEQKKLQLSELLKNSCCASAGGVKKKRKTEQRWVSCDSTTITTDDDDAMELDHYDYTTKHDKVQQGNLGKIVSAASSFALVPSLDPTLTEVSTRKNTNKNSDKVESKVEVEDEKEKNLVEATLPLTFASAMDIVFKNSPNKNKRISIGLHAPGKVVGKF